MTDTKDDDPAFPVTAGQQVYATGMSLRDYFAGQALEGMLASNMNGPAEDFARRSYLTADAMLRAREQGEG